MSVMIVTSLGELVIDLYTDRCPLTCKNFLKLCKIKYYNGCLFHTIQKDFTAQTGDPSGIGTGGDSIYKFLYGDQARFFSDEVHLDLKHLKVGTVAMASAGENLNASQFYITLREKLDYLDGKHTVFGEVAEGEDTLMRINDAYADETGRPFKNIRIKHTYILDDPFEDPPQLAELIPDASPEGKPKDEVEDDVRLEDDWVPMDEQLPAEQLEEIIRAKEAHSRAVVLESIGDIPDADVKPPENVLFVCKLNPVTEDEDLHTIFSRFGTVTSAEVIRDYKTGDSLCYAFIEFESQEACEQAYFKMDNALIDDRRIHVDFSQSVSKLWNQFRRKGGKQGKGCFKCGALDHIAKDCPSESGDSTVKPSQRYTLKVDNRQHGGGDNSRYEMVFAEDEGGRRNSSSKRERSSDDVRQRDHDAKDSRDRYRRSDRSRISEEDEKRYSSRADGHDSGSRRHEERAYNRTEDGDGRHDRAYRKRGIDYDRREDKADKLERINAEGERRDKRDEQSHRRKDDDRYRSSNRREGRDHHGRRSSEVHGDDERDRGRRDRRDSRR